MGSTGDDREADTVTTLRVMAFTNAIKNRRSFLRLFPCGVVAAAVSVAALLFSAGQPAFTESVTLKLIAACVATSYAGMGAGLLGGRKALQNQIQELIKQPLPEAMPGLLECLQREEATSNLAAEAMMRSVPAMTPAHKALFGVSDRKRLSACVAKALDTTAFYRYSPAVAVSLLNLCAVVCEPEDAPGVELAAHYAVKIEGEDGQRVRDALKSCLAALEGENLEADGISAPPVVERDDDIDFIVHDLSESTAARAKSLKATILCCLVGGAGAIASFRIPEGAGKTAALTAAVTGGVGILLFGLRDAYRTRNRLQTISKPEDVRLFAPLLKAAQSAEGSGATAALMVTGLLNNVEACRAELASPDLRRKLAWAMYNHSQNLEFVAAAIKALGAAGHPESIEVVRAAAVRAPRGEAGAEIRRAAFDSIEALEATAAQRKVSGTLLRASGPNADGSTSLLRATERAATEDQRELLRAGNSETKG
jgi:hypothetical protein